MLSDTVGVRMNPARTEVQFVAFPEASPILSPADGRWQGDLWLAADHCLITGVLGQTRSHAHYAHQLLIARAGVVEVWVQGEIMRGPALLIESGHEHAILNADQAAISLFAEPLAFNVPALQEIGRFAIASPDALVEVLRELPRRPLHPRLCKAVARIRSIDAATLSASMLASEAALSISQLERLFTGQLGLSVRRLVLWQRLRLALQLALEGCNLTRAAATAGFADSAHLSRCVRQQFGIRADQTLRNLRLRVLG